MATGLVLLAGLLVSSGLEAADAPIARVLGPAVGETDLGNHAFATMSGSVSSGYVETYFDTNANDVRDDGEATAAWYYFLVDPTTRAGVTVRSKRPPTDVFQVRRTGQVHVDPMYVAEDRQYFSDTIAGLDIVLDDQRYVDATVGVATPSASADLAALPGDGAPVTIAGASPPTGTRSAPTTPTSTGRATTRRSTRTTSSSTTRRRCAGWSWSRPSHRSSPATFTGVLHRDEHSVSEATTTTGLDFDGLGITVSPHYVLDEGDAPHGAAAALGIAAICGILAGVLLVGVAGGYLIYRRASRPLPAPARSLPVDGRTPLRVTGILRTAAGPLHVREAAADLLRFQTVVTGVEPDSTLIIERQNRPEGVAVGLGDSDACRRARSTRSAAPGRPSASSPGRACCSSHSTAMPTGTARRQNSSASRPRRRTPPPRVSRRVDPWKPGSWTRSSGDAWTVGCCMRSSSASPTCRLACT